MLRRAANCLYFPVLLALLKVSRRFPIRLRAIMISAIAATAFQISVRKRRAILRGLDAAFGRELAPARKRLISRNSFLQSWSEAFRLAPAGAEVAQLGHTPLRGEEHLRSASSRGRGVILLESSTFGSRAIARQVLHAHGYALHLVHGEKHIGSGFLVGERDWNWAAGMLRDFFERCEMESVAEIIHLPQSESLAFTRTLLDRLKSNALLCLAGEGRQSRRLVNQPFADGAAPFATGFITLARNSGAAILPVFCIRTNAGQMEVIVEAPIDVAVSPDREAAITAGLRQYASLLERYYRMYPEQSYGWTVMTSTGPLPNAIAGGPD